MPESNLNDEHREFMREQETPSDKNGVSIEQVTHYVVKIDGAIACEVRNLAEAHRVKWLLEVAKLTLQKLVPMQLGVSHRRGDRRG